MIVVIQCAGSKMADAPSLELDDGRAVRFVAQPEHAPNDGNLYAQPDDITEDGSSWREKLVRYNHEGNHNPLGLLPTAALYLPSVYMNLANALPVSHLFILSAGWGLLRSDFLTPAYDITFSAQAKPLNRRKRAAKFHDVCQLQMKNTEPLIFLGGKDYLPLFCHLTKPYQGTRTVFYNAAVPPQAEGCELKRFATNRRTNWHYDCAQAYLDGRLFPKF